MALYKALKGLIRPFKGLIRPFKGLIGPFKGLIRPLRALLIRSGARPAGPGGQVKELEENLLAGLP